MRLSFTNGTGSNGTGSSPTHSNHTNNSNRRASYNRSRTATVNTYDLDLMVLSYTQHDDAILTSLGRHSHETRWKVAVGLYQAPIDIVVHCDKGVASSPQVSVDVDGKTVREKAGLKEDYQWSVPFRSCVRNIGKRGYFEIRPAAVGTDHWFRATLTRQHQDGYFDATVQMPDGRGGFKEVDFPEIHKDNIREAGGEKRRLEMPSHAFVLDIPKKDPLHATLSVNGGEKLTHDFVRYSPKANVPTTDPKWSEAVKDARGKIQISVSKDRQNITADVGVAAFQKFLNGDIFAVTQKADSVNKHSWIIQLGPFGEYQHTVEIERQHPHRAPKVICLTVDDELLVESTAEDLESPQGYWACQFRFVGERCLDWEVYESDGNGRIVNSTGIVRQPKKFSVPCKIYFDEAQNALSEARFYIGDHDFTELPEPLDHTKDPKMTLQIEAFRATFDLVAPYKCKESLATPSSAIKPHAANNCPAGGLFACCSQAYPTASDDMVIINSTKDGDEQTEQMH